MRTHYNNLKVAENAADEVIKAAGKRSPLPDANSRRKVAWGVGAIGLIFVLVIIRNATARGALKSDLQTASELITPGRASKAAPFTNSLGMEFVPAGTQDLLFCRTETRVRDFRAFASANRAFASSQKGMEGYTLESDPAEGYTWKLAGGHWEDPHFEQGPDHPVVCVSQIDATAFCRWLTAEERAKGLIGPNDEYRLPTDDEWSAAAGPGEYPWGNAFPPPADAANLCGSESKTGPAAVPHWTVITDFNDGFPRTAPVGQFKENRFGLFDLSGNVWEICSSEYRKSMNSAEFRKHEPLLEREQSPDSTPSIVLRGGSWSDNDDTLLLASCRSFDAPTSRCVNLGFRVVLVVGGGG